MFVNEVRSLLRDRDLGPSSSVSGTYGVCGIGVSSGEAGVNDTFDPCLFDPRLLDSSARGFAEEELGSYRCRLTSCGSIGRNELDSSYSGVPTCSSGRP